MMKLNDEIIYEGDWKDDEYISTHLKKKYIKHK